MVDDVLIRAATNDDSSDCHRLFQELVGFHVRMHPEIFQEVDGPVRSDEAFAQWLEQDDRELFVALVHTQVVGLATVRMAQAPQLPMFQPRQVAVMDDLVVAQEFRGLGIGKKLLDRTARWAQARKAVSLSINVWMGEESGLPFYTAHGFTPLCQKMELRIDDVT